MWSTSYAYNCTVTLLTIPSRCMFKVCNLYSPILLELSFELREGTEVLTQVGMKKSSVGRERNGNF